jgi:hypothetical protein
MNTQLCIAMNIAEYSGEKLDLIITSRDILECRATELAPLVRKISYHPNCKPYRNVAVVSYGRSSSPGRVKNCHFSISTRPALGPTQPSHHWVQGLFPLLKRLGREADHSPPTGA